MQLVTETFGWMLTDQALSTFFIQPEGCAREACASPTPFFVESDVTPPGVDPLSITGVFFADAENGWVVANGPPRKCIGCSEPPVVYRTNDGGTTWDESPVLPDPPAGHGLAPGAPAYPNFIDTHTGWVVVVSQPATDLQAGVLYQTTDGGATWTELSITSGDPVYFTNANDGTSAGGRVTHDGGRTWTDPLVWFTPIDIEQTAGVPVLQDDRSYVVPAFVTDLNPDTPNAWLDLYRMTESPSSGLLVASSQDAQPPGRRFGWLPYVFTSGSALAISLEGDAGLHYDSDHGFQSFTGSGLAYPSEIQFIDKNRGWALVNACPSYGKCEPTPNHVEQTDDGGLTWSPLSFGSAPTPTP